MFQLLLITDTELGYSSLTCTMNSDSLNNELCLVMYRTVVNSSYKMSHENEGSKISLPETKFT